MLLGLIAAAGLGQLGKIAIFLLTLSILVVLHEYGHFIMARRNGVRVNEFAVGMGPKIFGWTSPRSGTLYSLRALPIGGYCAMEGEDNKSSEGEQQREFQNAPQRDSANFQAKSPWARLGIVVAGPVANFILAYIILLIATFAFGVPSDVPSTKIASINAGSPAAKAGLKPGDSIVAIDGQNVIDGKTLVNKIHGSLGKRIAITFDRGGAQTTTSAVPQPCPPQVGVQYGCIGFSPVFPYTRVGFFPSLAATGAAYVDTVDAEVQNLVLIATHFTQYASQISGPIGIGQAAVEVQDYASVAGWAPYFRLAALLSFALGVFNLLPLPALDGGRGAFIVAELLRGKPVDPEKEAMVHIAGFAVLMVLMIVIAFHDVTRIVSGQGVLN